MLEYPPYSLDLVPCDLDPMFDPRVHALKESHFVIEGKSAAAVEGRTLARWDAVEGTVVAVLVKPEDKRQHCFHTKGDKLQHLPNV